MPSGDPLVSIRGITKDYNGLRPLRIAHLDLHEGETVALVGLDRAGAEVLVDLVTAASLPDEGEVHIFGRSTRSITGSDSWLRELDHFGIVSERAVLLEDLTVEQNLALPLTLELHELPSDVRRRVTEIAEVVGLSAALLSQPMRSLDPLGRFNVRLGRALALDPRVLLAEHPNAAVAPDEASTVAAGFSRIIEQRKLTVLVLTADRSFAQRMTRNVLTLAPATGELKGSAAWRRWFG
jgi:ABC-type lipoprotein export system ATPase subunit